MKRVVVTGIGGITAFGRTWADIRAAFRKKENAVRKMDWNGLYLDLESRLGAPIENYTPYHNYALMPQSEHWQMPVCWKMV